MTRLTYYIVPDHNGPIGIISNRAGNKTLVYDVLGPTVYHGRIKLSDWGPVQICSDQNSWWLNLDGVDKQRREHLKEILHVDLDPNIWYGVAWEYVEGRMIDGDLYVISRHKNKIGDVEYSTSKITKTGLISWHRLEYEPEFKDGEILTYDEYRAGVEERLDHTIATEHKRIMMFIESGEGVEE